MNTQQLKDNHMNNEIEWNAPTNTGTTTYKGFRLIFEAVGNPPEQYYSFKAERSGPFWVCSGQAPTPEVAKAMCIAYADMIGDCQ